MIRALDPPLRPSSAARSGRGRARGVDRARSAWTLRAAAGLLALALAPGCARQPVAYNVLLITVDTLRADHLSVYGYERPTSPGLEELARDELHPPLEPADRRALGLLARDALVFTHAQTPRAKTTPAVASLFTGLYPHHHHVRDLASPLAEDVPLLAESFRDAGYRTVGVIGNWVLKAERSGLQRGFEVWDEELPQEVGVPPDHVPQRTARSLTDAALAALADGGDAPAGGEPRPWFAWLHYMDPHGLYDPPAEHRVFESDAVELIPSEAELGPHPIHRRRVAEYNLHPDAVDAYGRPDAQAVRDLYDGEIRFVDAEVARLLRWLEDSRHRDDTLIVFTADHGESLGEHRYWFEHGFYTYEATCRVPLVIRLPRAMEERPPPGIRAGDVSLVDLTPTLLELVGLPPLRVPADVPRRAPRGVSRAGLVLRGQAGEHPVFSEKIERSDVSGTVQAKAVRLGDWKFIRRYTQRAPLAPAGERGLVVLSEELYDLESDPSETRNLIAAPPAGAPLDRLRAELLVFAEADVHFADLAQILQRQREELEREDPEGLRVLEALGYRGRRAMGSSPAADAASDVPGDAPDDTPHDNRNGDRRWRLTLAALALLLLAVKLLLVLSLADVFFYGEELEKGTASKAMLDGLGVPHHQLAYHYYEGGGFAVSHLTALAFALVGECLLAHKLVSLGFNLAILLVGASFVRRRFGDAAGTLFGVLLVLAPPGFQKISLLNLGIHFESSLFLLAIIALAAGVLLDADERPRRRLFLLGVVCGLGLYFNYQNLPLVGYALGLVALLRPRRLLGGGLELAALGLFLGLLPLLATWVQVGPEVFDIHGTALFGGGDAKPAGRTAEPHLDTVRSILWSKSAWELPATGLRVALPLLGAALFLRRRGPRPGAPGELGAPDAPARAYLFVLAYLALFALVYLASPFGVGRIYHHFLLQRLTPFWVLGTVLTAAALGRLLGSGASRRRLGLAAAAVLVVGGALETARIAAAGRPAELLRNARILLETKGYTYPEYFAKFVRHLDGDYRDKIDVLVRFDEPDRELLYSGIAWVVFDRVQATRQELLTLVRSTDREHWQEFAVGFGPYLYRLAREDLGRAVELIESYPAELREPFLEAVGRRGIFLRAHPDKLREELELIGARDPGSAYWRGFGHRVYLAHRLDPDGAEAFLAGLRPGRRAPARAGYEYALGLHSLAR